MKFDLIKVGIPYDAINPPNCRFHTPASDAPKATFVWLTNAYKWPI